MSRKKKKKGLFASVNLSKQDEDDFFSTIMDIDEDSNISYPNQGKKKDDKKTQESEENEAIRKEKSKSIFEFLDAKVELDKKFKNDSEKNIQKEEFISEIQNSFKNDSQMKRPSRRPPPKPQ